MAEIHNSNTIKRILDDAGIQTSIDDVPKILASKVVPILISNPQRNGQVLGALYNRDTTGSGVSMFITKSDEDSYVTGMIVSHIADAVCDNIVLIVHLPIESGDDEAVYWRHKATTTAINFYDVLTFDPPIKLRRNDDPQFTGTFTVGDMTTTTILLGYTVKTNKG